MTISSELIVSIAGVILSLLFSYIPGLRTWYAAQFLVAHDGAELWLRSLGLGVTQEMRSALRLLAIGAR